MKIQPATTSPYYRRPLPQNLPEPVRESTPEPQNPHAETEAIIRRALRLSFVVYDPLDHLKEVLTYAGFTSVQPINAWYTETQGICCVRGKTAYIAFRGSASIPDWVLDFLCIPFYWPLRHFGFGSAWLSVRGKVKKWLKDLPPDVEEIMICGHSLGGGIAHLAALGLAEEHKIGAVVTFGAPKACFLGTADRYNKSKVKSREEKLGDITYAVVNQRDLVSKVPLDLMGFRDVGRLVYIDKSSKVCYGDTAWRSRLDESMADFDFILNFMEEEKIGIIGPNSTPFEQLLHGLRRGLAFAGKASPPIKMILWPPVMYILCSLYFARSSLAHLSDKYMSVFPEKDPAWRYVPYVMTKWEKFFSVTKRFILIGIVGAAFLWGLYHVVDLAISGVVQRSGTDPA